MASPHESTVGVVIEYTVLDEAGVPLDISGAATKQLIFKKPNGVVVAKTADFVSDGTDGKLKYTSIAGDLIPYGIWECQANVVKVGIINGRTERASFPVLRNL